MSKKLKNVKAVREMVAGTHKSQTKTTVGFGETKTIVKREVGDRWTDDNGNVWEQKKGYKVKLGKLSELRKELNTFPNCKKEICTCTNPKRNDIKMKTIHAVMNEPELGIIFTKCRKCVGKVVAKSSDAIKCTDCGWIDERKLSSNFGKSNFVKLRE